MGIAKQEWIETQENGYSLPNLGEKYVCADHFDDQYLKQYINENSEEGICGYCGNSKQVIDFSDFMEYVTSKIVSNYGDPDREDLPLENSYYDDEDDEIPFFQQVGSYVVPRSAEVYDSTRELLYEIGLVCEDEKLNKDIEDCFINDTWVQLSPFSMSRRQELSYMWQKFAREVKHEQRFTFFNKVESPKESSFEDRNLMDILDELGTIISAHNLCYEIYVGTKIYRCRFVDIDKGETAKTFEELTSAPDHKAKQSRMSAAGISMFYGAFEIETSKAESFEEGKTPIIGVFETKKKLNVLDLTNLPNQSFWMPVDWEGLDFLHSFRKEIEKKIEKNDKVHFEYVPSQIFSEYLRNIFTSIDRGKIDGMIYGSTLDSCKGKKNIVLFYNQQKSKEILDLSNIISEH